MNTPNPLVPQGALPQAPRVKSNVRFAVVGILALHAVLFSGLLMQGCKREDAPKPAGEANNALPPFDPSLFASNQAAQAAAAAPAPADSNQPTPPPQPGAQPQGAAQVAGQPMPPQGQPQPAGQPQPPVAQPTPPPQPVAVPEPQPAPVGGPSEYVVVKGDSFSSIAKAHGISSKAIAAANPGVDSTRLKLGQKLVLPAPSATAPAAANAVAAVAEAGEGSTYVVKSGDSLIKISKHVGVSVKALKAANNLKTDAIKVGQKLKVPAAGGAAAAAAPAQPTVILNPPVAPQQ